MGFSQEKGIDHTKTFTPVAKMDITQIILSSIAIF